MTDDNFPTPCARAADDLLKNNTRSGCSSSAHRMRGCLISWPPHLFSPPNCGRKQLGNRLTGLDESDKKGNFTGEWWLPSHFGFGLCSIWWFTNFRFSAVTFCSVFASFCCLCWKQQKCPLSKKDTSESKLDIPLRKFDLFVTWPLMKAPTTFLLAQFFPHLVLASLDIAPIAPL
jgi:hypothetical protein